MSWERMIAKNTANRTVLVKATPRLSCIVLRRLQIRVRLTTTAASEQPSLLRMMVTRRKDRILIASNQRLRVLMLKFKSIQECLAFSDQLAALNPAPAIVVPAQQAAVEPNNQVAFYISRLLHDPEFASFCRRLESSLVASQDGLKALQALAHEEESIENHTNHYLSSE
jgi:hypothetical protein